ncbi:MAG: sulfite exporter TauE/SafE family protein [Phycisphaerae bacterium]
MLAITGLAAGVLGGLLGVGGSVIMIPAMAVIFSAVGSPHSIHQYQAAAMIVSFVLVWPAVLRHRRARAIRVDVWKLLAPAALVGIVGGVLLSRAGLFTGDNELVLRRVFGLFMLYVAAYNTWKIARPARRVMDSERPASPNSKATLAVGAAMGVSAGLLGIGGGALAVPAQQVILRLPLRNAIATSAATIAAITWLGAIVKNASLGADGTVARSLLLTAALAPTAMAGSYVGGHLTHRLPVRWVRAAFVVLMLVAGVKMLTWTAGV